MAQRQTSPALRGRGKSSYGFRALIQLQEEYKLVSLDCGADCKVVSCEGMASHTGILMPQPPKGCSQ